MVFVVLDTVSKLATLVLILHEFNTDEKMVFTLHDIVWVCSKVAGDLS